MIAFFLGGFSVYYLNCENPPDLTGLTVIGEPADTDFRCVVFEQGGHMEAMYWYTRFFCYDTMHPSHCTNSYGSIGPHLNSSRFTLKWQSAERYGIAVRNTSGKWTVYWFRPNEIDLYTPLIGRRHVTFELDKASTVERASPDRLRQAGLDEAITM